MKKILVASHGQLADGVKSSLSILVGNTDSIRFINAYVTKEDIDESLNTFFSSVSEDDEVIIFTDLLGGSVNQKVTLRAQKHHAFIIAGFNLPIILEVLFLPEPITKETLNQKIETCRQAMVLVEPEKLATNEDSEEDFLD
ncbi:PTS sugar transporter subunit IIA [Sporolactobacillus terrae]|uniref:PTS fructose transporter subunit IIA n=1 Tax=Sporolactobacillus terrae TaxID=269673 RepID=A0ABX5Q585_9BACL|nr:PTS fructose transporter subunit IIA [Sporolactobacillus terrae]QAA21764.1 PTS fructose transporter subunit IIA [Sporolactobacillus terrae]QAA24737.1 PTS fructose transporter subunit IIA [Sporolactobacillus terrae]UAK16566.1 PTS fructose transporter subunit IIA [Sporolactobacillus terrae]